MNKYTITLDIEAEDAYQAEDWIDWLLEKHFEVEETVKVYGVTVKDPDDKFVGYQRFKYDDKEEESNAGE